MRKKRLFNNQFVCDFETLHEETQYFQNLPEDKKDTRIIYWYAKHMTKDNVEFEGIDGNSFMDWILNIKINTTIWFHNLSFDGTYIIPLLLKYGFKVVNTEFKDNQFIFNGANPNGQLKSKYFNVFMNGNKIYEIQFFHTRRINGSPRKTTIQFRCSFVLLSSSIGSLGNSLSDVNFMGQTLRKMSDEEKAKGSKFYVVEPEESLEVFYSKNIDFVNYCKRDVEIARLSLLRFNEAVNHLPTIKEYMDRENARKKANYKFNALSKSLTIGGLSRELMNKIYVRKFERENWEKYKFNGFLKIDTDTHNFIKSEEEGSKFFKGGFVQFNPQFQTNQETKWVNDGIKIDVVSAYPFQMTKPLPYGRVMNEVEFLEIRKENWVVGVDYVEWLIINVKVARPKPICKYCSVLPNYTKEKDLKKDIKYRYNPNKQENFVMHLSRQEFEELKHWVDFELEGIEHYYQLAAPFLKAYAEEVVSMKTKFGIEKKAAFKQAMKILANSAYGSLGIRQLFDVLAQMDLEGYEIIKDLKGDVFSAVDYANEKVTSAKYVGDSGSRSLGNNKCIRVRTNQTKQEHFNIACAAYITSMQRIYILETIRRFGPQYFVYSDTDSIIFCNFPKETRKAITSICGIELGNWEIEKEFILGFTCRKAKDYSVVYLENGVQKVENKNAGFIGGSEYEKIILDFFYEDDETYTLDDITIEKGSITRIRYPSGVLLVNVDKINSKSTN